jgi:hypothetical protein
MPTLNLDFPLRDKGVSNSLGTGVFPRHRWYFVKEGFSPTLVERAIETEKIEKGDLLLDLFSGGGTVALTGALKGLRTDSYEVNPFLHFLSATKLRKAAPDALTRSSEALVKGLRAPTPSHLEGFSTFTKGNRWNRWLFPSAVLRSFEGGYRALAKTPPEHADLLKLALIGAAVDCSNASRDGKCLRYPKKWQENESSADDLLKKFRSRIQLIAEDLRIAPLPKASARVINGDARSLLASKPPRQKFRLCVTSPPYLNSFDYSDIYRPELFLGRFVESNAALMKVRLKTLRSHVQASWAAPKKDEFGLLYANCINELRQSGSLWDPRIPKMVQAYFEDMDKILRQLRLRALKNASVWIVVSTSAYGGVQVPVDLILAEIGERAGWALREVGVLRHLRSSSQHVKHVNDVERKSVPLRESVVILDAKPAANAAGS